MYVLKQIDFSDLQVCENSPEYGTYRILVNQLLEGLADIEEGRVQDFNEAMKEIRKNLKYESVTICHQFKRKTALWECEDYLSSEKIYIYLQENSVRWLLIASVRSFSCIRINCFGLLVNQFADYSKIIDSIFYTELINGIYGIYW